MIATNKMRKEVVRTEVSVNFVQQVSEKIESRLVHVDIEDIHWKANCNPYSAHTTSFLYSWDEYSEKNCGEEYAVMKKLTN